jgi:hypothetical protein
MRMNGSRLAGVPVALALVLGTVSAAAQDVKLQFVNGRVTLDARNVSVGAILDEWARIGHTTIVNGTQVNGDRVTLRLVDAAERAALNALLRDVRGYILAARSRSTPHASTFDRVIILPGSPGAPHSPPVRPRAGGADDAASPAPPHNHVPLPSLDSPDDLQDLRALDDEDVGGVSLDDAETSDRARVAAPPMPVPFPVPQSGIAAAHDDGTDDQVPAVQTTPRNPFGLPRGSGGAGVVTPLPRPNPAPTYPGLPAAVVPAGQ